ncbi:MAG TPA: hypothetical protein VF432_17325 [Thermoanaerobaculia bacterium]
MSSSPDTNVQPYVFTRHAGRVVQTQPVVVTDFQMPFSSMVGFMVKWVIAAIPALIILSCIFAVLGALLGGFFASLLRS